MVSLTTKDLFFNHKLGPFSLWQQVGTLRKQIKASEQGTKQVGTCLLRYLSYIDWVFIIPLGKVSAGAKVKSHRHRPLTKGQAPDFVLYTCKKPSFSFIDSFENRTFSKFYLLTVVDREVSVHWVSRMFQLLFEQIPQTVILHKI